MTIPIRPPFTLETALARVHAAEDAWKSRDPVRVSLAYSADSIWRNRDQFVSGRGQIQAFRTANHPEERRRRVIRALDARSDEESRSLALLMSEALEDRER